MKFGIRTPSIKKSISARTSPKRIVKNSLGLKAPKGYGIITDPKKAIYNKVYNKTTTDIKSADSDVFGCLFFIFISIVLLVLYFVIF